MKRSGQLRYEGEVVFGGRYYGSILRCYREVDPERKYIKIDKE